MGCLGQLFLFFGWASWCHAVSLVGHRDDVYFLDGLGLESSSPRHAPSLSRLLLDQQQNDCLQLYKDGNGNEFLVLHLVPPLPSQLSS